MLLIRSAFLYILIISVVFCQEYDAQHHAEADHDDHDHSSYSDGDDHHFDQPDYSKYYSSDASAPIVQSPLNEQSSGFIPSDFNSFFGHSDFDFGGTASNKKEVANPQVKQFGFVTNNFKPTQASPIPDRDFFEESQQKNNQKVENADTYESRPGPNYISHSVPIKQKYAASNVDEVESDKENVEEYDFGNEKEDVKDIDDLYYDKKKASSKYAQQNKNNNVDVTTEKYNFNYNDGKSSYTGTGNNHSPDYYSRLTSTPTLTPYQKFSFQPIDDYGFKPAVSESKIAPFNPNYNNYVPVPTIKTDFIYPDATATVATKIANNKSNCKKINKLAPNDAAKGQIMDCYSCEDPKTGHSYEQCSYNSEPTPKAYYFTNSKLYKPPTQSQSYRYKRYTSKENINDPYEYVKSQSQSEYPGGKDYQSEGEEYRFGPEYFEDDTDKNYSAQESEKLVSDGEHCVKTKKSGMTCMVCKNEKTGGKYEQCAYATEPQEQKYAYVKEKKFNSKDIPEEEAEQTEQKPVKKPKYKKYSAKLKGEKPRKPVEIEFVKPIDTRRQRSEKIYVPKKKNSKPEYENKENYDIPQYYQDSSNVNTDTVGVDAEEYYGNGDENEELNNDESEAQEEEAEEDEDESKPNKSPYALSEYHFKIFPEFSNEESKNEEKRVQKPEEQIHAEFESDQTKDVEEVLAEFAKKDRSKCTKAEKQGMTCYLCVDDNGLQNEECMYVSESKPTATYAAYHEAKELKDKKKRVLQPEESKNIARKVKTQVPYDVEATDSKQVDSSTSLPVGNGKLTRKYGRDKNISRTLPIPLAAQESQLLESRIKRNSKYTKKTTKQSKKQKQEKDEDLSDDVKPKTYEHEKLEGPDGAYSAETRPVYSKVYGATLPKYMLEKSISEQEFDDFVSSS